MKRGYTYAEAMEYVGVKRRKFDEDWKPRLTPIQQGTSTIYDRVELDALFDEFKAAARQPAANDDIGHTEARNGRPTRSKGVFTWANKRGASIPQKTGLGTSTSNGAAPDFSNVASRLLTTRKGG